jgi:hypothetical protein
MGAGNKGPAHRGYEVSGVREMSGQPCECPPQRKRLSLLYDIFLKQALLRREYFATVGKEILECEFALPAP